MRQKTTSFCCGFFVDRGRRMVWGRRSVTASPKRDWSCGEGQGILIIGTEDGEPALGYNFAQC